MASELRFIFHKALHDSTKELQGLLIVTDNYVLKYENNPEKKFLLAAISDLVASLRLNLQYCGLQLKTL